MGDLVIVNPTKPEDIKINDIIAFKDSDKKFPVTHRVINITEEGFITKGDANEDPDAKIVKANDIIGKIEFNLPLAGYLIYFAKTRYGFILLIVIPGILIIVSEVKKILSYVKESKKIKPKRKSKGKQSKGTTFPLILLVLSLILLTSLSLSTIPTNAYFSDTEISSGNTFTAWSEEVPPITIKKWWSDTEFNSISEFKVVVIGKSNKVVATNPGGFYINIEIDNIPETDSFSLTDTISGAIRPKGDFGRWPPFHGKPLHIYLDGNDITEKFNYTFNGSVLNVILKQGEILPKGEKLYITFHLRYALIGTELTKSEKEMFPRTYSNKATLTIGDRTFKSSPANLTAHLKLVSCKKLNPHGFQCGDDLILTSETLEIDDCELADESESDNLNIQVITKDLENIEKNSSISEIFGQLENSMEAYTNQNNTENSKREDNITTETNSTLEENDNNESVQNEINVNVESNEMTIENDVSQNTEEGNINADNLGEAVAEVFTSNKVSEGMQLDQDIQDETSAKIVIIPPGIMSIVSVLSWKKKKSFYAI